MPGRIQFTLPKSCDCGARGTATFEEDDIHERKEGGANTKLISVEGPFRLGPDGRTVCLRCEEKAR